MSNGQSTMADEVIGLLEKRQVVNSNLNDWIDQARRRVDWDKAIYLCSESRKLAAQAGEESEYCCAMIDVYEGALHHAMGDLTEASECYARAQERFSHIDACDTQWNAAVACYAGGLVCQCQGKLADALARLNQAITSIKGLRNPNMRAGVERIRQRMFYLQDRYHQQRTQEEAENLIPIVGIAAAGYPMLAIPLASDDVFSDKVYVKGMACEVKHMLEAGRANYLELPRGKSHFVVRVEGESMTAIGIENGDYVVFRQQPEVAQGEIAVVRIDDIDGARSTVKRIYRNDSKTTLKAENPEFQPQEQNFGVHDPTLHVLGKAIATLCVSVDT